MKTILKPFFYLFLTVYFIFNWVIYSLIYLYKRMILKGQELSWAKIKYKHKIGSVGILFKNK